MSLLSVYFFEIGNVTVNKTQVHKKSENLTWINRKRNKLDNVLHFWLCGCWERRSGKFLKYTLSDISPCDIVKFLNHNRNRR